MGVKRQVCLGDTWGNDVGVVGVIGIDAMIDPEIEDVARERVFFVLVVDVVPTACLGAVAKVYVGVFWEKVGNVVVVNTLNI